VTPSEIAFLVMGLALGLAVGAAVLATIGTRSSAQNGVRLTVAPDAVPRRRGSTLADDAFAVPLAGPARGGPAELDPDDAAGRPGSHDLRTNVRSAPSSSTAGSPVMAGPPGRGEGTPGPRIGHVMEPAFPLSDPGGGAPRLRPVGFPIDSGADPMIAELRASAAVAAVTAMRAAAPVATMQRDPIVGASRDDAERARAAARKAPRSEPPPDMGDLGSLGDSVAAEAAARRPAPAGSCDDERRLADERCELATRARAQATGAEETLRAAQRAYDDHESRGDEAAAATDPRAVRSAKDEAQARFRGGRGGATTTEAVEAAARAWLLEINRINAEARESTATMTHEREAARMIGATLERTALEAETARMAAETAEAACLQAREAVAACEERAAGAVPGHEPRVPSGAPDGAGNGEAQHEPLVAMLRGGGAPRIFRLLRGDRTALIELVGLMGGEDQGERRRWQVGLADLVDAILADSIEASALDFPLDHAFWGPFNGIQARDIASALASLGYRFDGRGGWVDGRIPSQRDLSLALGYAGLDPMRMRHWPAEPEMHALFADVTVAADEHLASHAGDLTLGELVTMLGRRADSLTDVWNAWGRLRPLLLEDA
jgi:hypothetical protein